MTALYIPYTFHFLNTTSSIHSLQFFLKARREWKSKVQRYMACFLFLKFSFFTLSGSSLRRVLTIKEKPDWGHSVNELGQESLDPSPRTIARRYSLESSRVLLELAPKNKEINPRWRFP